MRKPTVPVKSWSPCRFPFSLQHSGEKKSDRDKKQELAFPDFGAGIMLFVCIPFWVGGKAQQTTCTNDRAFFLRGICALMGFRGRMGLMEG